MNKLLWAICIKEEEDSMNDDKQTTKQLYRRVTRELHKIGTPAHIKGHDYLRDAIIYVYMDTSYIRKMMGRLYPDIAAQYHTNISCVERGIRNAIEVSWNRGDMDVLTEVFGNTVSYSRARPTNSEFIAMLADRLHLEDDE